MTILTKFYKHIKKNFKPFAIGVGISILVIEYGIQYLGNKVIFFIPGTIITTIFAIGTNSDAFLSNTIVHALNALIYGLVAIQIHKRFIKKK